MYLSEGYTESTRKTVTVQDSELPADLSSRRVLLFYPSCGMHDTTKVWRAIKVRWSIGGFSLRDNVPGEELP